MNLIAFICRVTFFTCIVLLAYEWLISHSTESWLAAPGTHGMLIMLGITGLIAGIWQRRTQGRST